MNRATAHPPSAAPSTPATPPAWARPRLAGRLAARASACARALAAALLLAAQGAGIAQAQANHQELRLAVSSGPVSLPIYVAQSQGYFKREGVGVQLLDCSSGRACFQMQSQGQADLATSAELLVALNSFNSPDTAIIATLSKSMRHIKLVARRSAGVKGPEDLRGKRIATVAGTSAQYFLDSWLVFHEIDPQSVSVVPMAPDRLTGALAQGEVQAIAIWEPLASANITVLGQDAVVMPNPRVYTQHFSLIAKRQLIAEREAELIALLRALARAEGFIAEHPEHAARILQSKLKDSANPGNLAEHEFKLTLDQSLISTMDAQARWAVLQGIAPANRKPDNLLRSIEPSLLRKAAPGVVNLVQ